MRPHWPALASLCVPATALTPTQWRNQSIYQIMTDRFAHTDGSTIAPCDVDQYCGGTWAGITNKLDYIQNMGFTAIWISPIVENIPDSTVDGTAYHGYWAQDIYAVNTNFGPASDLLELSAALHARGMYLMVDIVTNHVAHASSRTQIDFEDKCGPFNNASMYHQPCDINYTNQTSVTDCWLGDDTVSLADLRTEDAEVSTMWNNWIEELVLNYTIDGLRVDSAMHVDQASLASLQSAAGGMHIIAEIYNQDPEYVCQYQESVSGMMNYPMYYWITEAFTNSSGSISNLVNGIDTMKSTCTDVTVMGSFIENHDNPRFPALTSDQSLIRNAVAFPFVADGIPILYQGQEQKLFGGTVPWNREALWQTGYSTDTASTLYGFITTLNKIRSWAMEQDASYLTYNALPIYSDWNSIVLRKGCAGKQILSVFTNLGEMAGPDTITIDSAASGLTAGEVVQDVFSCQTYTADGLGALAVTITTGLPQVLYPQAALSGSGLC